jgi:hemolysin activation/secretion protein/AraC-like DNA-binding protein
MQKLNQLFLEAIKLAAGEEWMDGPGAWRLVRVQSGAAYWLSDGNNRPLAEGEVLIVPPQAEGLVRASQIGDVLLHGFKFSPDMLCGFFTLTERDFLEARGRSAAGDVQFLPSTHPVAQQFAAMVPALAAARPLPLRVTALGLVAAVFDGEMAQHRPLQVRGSTAQERFEKMIVRMPETEIINHTPEELARLCGCSPRHFNRLFREQFGVSARARQTELRLLKSRQLLAGSDDKIINIAVASGYRNLSLFNSLFKKRFGQTPSQWRKSSAKPPAKTRRPGLGALVAFLLMLFAAPLLADGPAGSVPAPAAAPAKPAARAPLTFKVKGYELEGNTLLPPDIYEPVFSRYTGDAVTFDIIRLCLADLQLAYRHRGFMTVAVSLPQQQLTNGVVRIKVTEGRLVDVVVKGNKHFRTDNILRALPSARTNTLLNALVFQEELDRANANNDRQVYPVISPGPDPGTTVLELRVKDRLPFHMHMELNNYYTPGTPDLRLNLSGVYNNLWQLDHQFGLQYSLSPESLKSRNGVLADDSDKPPYVPPYDRPQVVNYSTFYRMPLGPLNGYPHEYTVADFGYDEVTHRFRPPPLTGSPELIFFASRSYSDTGSTVASQTLSPNVNFNQGVPETSTNAGGGLQIVQKTINRTLSPNEDLGFRLTKPLPPLDKMNSTVSAGMDFKNYRSLLLQAQDFSANLWEPYLTNSQGFAQLHPVVTTNVPGSDTNRTVFTSVQYLPVSLDWSGSVADKFGATIFDFGQSFNLTGWLGNRRDFQAVTGTTNTDGNYYVATVSLTRDQKFWHDWGVKLHADGQWANQPLISNEQFGLGGQAGVRGYIDGDQYGDCGWRVQFEPHTPYVDLGLVDGDTPMLTRFYTFVDYGQTISQNPAASPGTTSLLGAGCGVDASIGEHFDFRLMFGVPFIGVPNATESSTIHVAFSLAAQL